MAFTISATNIGQNHITLGALLQLLNTPHPPADVPFPSLGNPVGHTTNLGPHQAAPIALGNVPAVVRSIGLITCASFVFVDAGSGNAWVLHANSGVISVPQFQAAIAGLGLMPAAAYPTVQVAMAHPGASDPGYQASVALLVNNGVPTGQVVEITDVIIPSFGINNLLQIGF